MIVYNESFIGDKLTAAMSQTPTIRSHAHLQPISSRTAKRLGLKTRRFIEEGGQAVLTVVPVQDIWIETPLGDGWVASYRLVETTAGGIQVTELRVVQREPDHAHRPPGTSSASWQGIDAPGPVTPLQSRHVHAARVAPQAERLAQLATLFRQLRADTGVAASTSRQRTDDAIQVPPMNEARDMVFGPPERDPAEPSGHGESVAVRTGGAKKRPGPKPTYSDADYARIAVQYIEACERNVPAIRAIAAARGVSPTTARGLVARARQQGLLIGGYRGRQGAYLSADATRLLRTRPSGRSRPATHTTTRMKAPRLRQRR